MAGIDVSDIGTSSGSSNFLIVNHENGGIWDLFKFLLYNDQESGGKFIEGDHADGLFDEVAIRRQNSGEVGPDHRWVIVASILVRKIIKLVGKPMECVGFVVEFILNLLSLNGEFLGLLSNFINGNVVMPERGSESFISAIGHLDGRIDLSEQIRHSPFDGSQLRVEMTEWDLLDMCIMTSKLAYENHKVVKNIVNRHWKMHFVGFYNCWNDYQKENSTQVFILCDKPKDANLIVISFRGTEPFDADDWITDFDYSWYEIPKLGKVHMGFLEALGLGNRVEVSTFDAHLQANTTSTSTSTKAMGKTTAYYAVRSKLKDLLQEHANAKFVVTGHSMGGALAVLFPTVLVLHEQDDLMQQLLGVYTFGQPRVGNEQLGRHMQAHLQQPQSKYFRVVYCNDLIPRLPYDNKTFLYKHFGVCLYFNSLYVEKNVEEEPNRNYFGWRFLAPQYLNSVWELLRSFMMGYLYGPGYKETWESVMLRVVGLAIPGLSAHGPVDYVNSVRLGRRRFLEMVSL